MSNKNFNTTALLSEACNNITNATKFSWGHKQLLERSGCYVGNITHPIALLGYKNYATGFKNVAEIEDYEKKLLHTALYQIKEAVYSENSISERDAEQVKEYLIKAIKYSIMFDYNVLAKGFLKVLTHSSFKLKYKGETIAKYVKKIIANYAKRSILTKEDTRYGALNIMADALNGEYGEFVSKIKKEAFINMFNDTKVTIVEKFSWGESYRTLKCKNIINGELFDIATLS